MAVDKDIKIRLEADASSALAAINSVSSAINGLNGKTKTTTAQTAGLNSALNKTGSSAKSASIGTFALGNIFGNMGLKAFRWGKQLAGAYTEIGAGTLALQRNLGGTAEEMSSLLAISNQYNVDTNALIVSFRTFAQQAITGTKAFRDLGLEVKDSSGAVKSSLTLFKEAADKLNNLGSIVERTAAGGVLFGRRFKDLQPILALGSQGINEALNNVKKLGLTLDQDGVNKAVRFTYAQKQMHMALQGFSVAIATQVVPALATLVTAVTNVMSNFTGFIKQHQDLGKVILWLIGIFGSLYATIKLTTLATTIFSTVTGGFAFIKGAVAGLEALAVGYDLVTAASTAAAISEGAAMLFNPLTAVAAVTAGIAVGFLAKQIMGAVSAAKTATSIKPPAVIDPSTGDVSYVPGSGISKKDKSKLNAAKKVAATAKEALKEAKENLKIVTEYWKDQVDTAQKALDEAKAASERYKTVLSTIADMITGASNLPDMFSSSFARYVGPSSMINFFKKRVDDMRKFLADIQTLGNAGLDPDMLMQIVAAGPQQGLEMAESIVNDPNMIQDIGDLNNLGSQMQQLQTGFNTYTGGLSTFKPSSDAYNSIPGLTSNLDTALQGQKTYVDSAQTKVDTAQTTYDNAVTTVNHITTVAMTNANASQIGNAVDRALRTRQPVSTGSVGGSSPASSYGDVSHVTPRVTTTRGGSVNDVGSADYWLNSANGLRNLDRNVVRPTIGAVGGAVNWATHLFGGGH